MSLQDGYQTLKRLDPNEPHSFSIPTKKINDGEQDLPFFLTSTAYVDIMTFIFQLNISMFPQTRTDYPDSVSSPKTFSLDHPNTTFSAIVLRLQSLLDQVDRIIDEVPPDPGPRRFGNMSFRKWYERVTSQAPALLTEALPGEVLNFKAAPSAGAAARDELLAYFLGGFGSPQRLDYGTGHELSFVAFLGCIWKLGGFDTAEPGVEERGIVLGVFEPYLRLVRRLILTYNLEPAGSHGVWGLDDHSFLPYIFGSAELSPPIPELSYNFRPDSVPMEGSLANAPSPSDVTRKDAVERERKSNMYFSAIGFIYDVKKGPFWEHSPVLYDISGIPAGWAKINKGMLKMYNAEVLSKFPVVQHFPFGSLFRWEKDPTAVAPPTSAHSNAQKSHQNTRMQQNPSTAHPAGTRGPQPSHYQGLPQVRMVDPVRSRASRQPTGSAPAYSYEQSQQLPIPGVPSMQKSSQTPITQAGAAAIPATQAPWAKPAEAAGGMPATTAPWATQKGTSGEPLGMPPTRAPWAENKLPER